jgi:hypothetical protein
MATLDLSDSDLSDSDSPGHHAAVERDRDSNSGRMGDLRGDGR